MVEYLDRRAKEMTTTGVRCSRAGYVRELIERDMQATAAAA